jgi:hypothetical protein
MPMSELSAAEVGRRLRDGTHVSESDRRAADIAAERARRQSNAPKSKRFADYRRNSRIEPEAAQGERDVEAQARAKAKARR